MFQLWILDYAKIHEPVCQSLSAFFCVSALEDCKLAACNSTHRGGGTARQMNSEHTGTWQPSRCYTLPAPCASLIHCSVLRHDNPTHMSQPHTQCMHICTQANCCSSYGGKRGSHHRLTEGEKSNHSRCHRSLTHPCAATITFVIT